MGTRAVLLSLVLALGSVSPAFAAGWALGIGVETVAGELAFAEWGWALRGGGVEWRPLRLADLEHPSPDTPLIILDGIPLSRSALAGLTSWVRNGGILLYADAAAALKQVGEDGSVREGRGFLAQELLGARYGGIAPELIGSYPDVVADTALLSPLRAGDALRLGQPGIGGAIRVEAVEAEVLARSARLSYGPGEIVLALDAATILSRQYGRGRVVFLSFSPARVAACYPRDGVRDAATDCSGAAAARALMRWLAANLLWEERRLQIPLLWETPGVQPHGFLITGDVHAQRQDGVVRSEVLETEWMTGVLQRLQLPASFYFEGIAGEDRQHPLAALRDQASLELSVHGFDGTVLVAKNYPFPSRWWMTRALRRAESGLGLAPYPDHRGWLRSARSHGWVSDAAAWEAMHRVGIGVVFDQVADTIQRPAPWRVPPRWYAGGERRRLFVPLFERSIATSAADFRLNDEQARDMALLAAAQPEPIRNSLGIDDYFAYVRRWHALFRRLAVVGGLTEVWLWHPNGLGSRAALAAMERALSQFQAEEGLVFLRGDVLSTWHANRERCRVSARREEGGALVELALQQPTAPILPLPPGAPDFAETVSYWVVGTLQLPGWQAHTWTDAAGRPITVLSRPLGNRR